MKEVDRNKRLLDLTSKLVREGNKEAIELLETMVVNDTEAIQHSFKLMTQPSPLATLFGVNNLGQLENDKKEEDEK